MTYHATQLHAGRLVITGSNGAINGHVLYRCISQVTEQAIYRLEQFFYSDWFMMLTKLDPSYIIRKIEETINGKFVSD